MKRNHRDRIEIIADFLRALEKGEHRIGRILHTANLNCSRFREIYAPELVSTGLITQTFDDSFYLTEKGNEWLQVWRRLISMVPTYDTLTLNTPKFCSGGLKK